jgi:large subunit ribosomal protein L22
MKTQATAKFVGTSARKTGLVAALIRGLRASDAQAILANTSKRATVPVGKVLDSAIANAENNFNAKARDLVVESVLIGPGPSLKRSRTRGKGGSAAILKRSSHITVVVSDGQEAVTLNSAKSEITKPVEDKAVEPKAEAAKPKAAKAKTETKQEEAK